MSAQFIDARVTHPEASLQITRVLANAGSGKTHKLSADFLRIAHRGVVEGDPARLQSILATTFTRASARDIRNKVLLRVANATLDPAARRELAESIFGSAARAPEVRCEELLDALIQRLDRLEIRTIDGFLARVASAFSLELGLAPGTTPIIERTAIDRINTEALARIIRDDPERARILLQAVRSDRVKRDLAAQLLEATPKLLEIWRDSQPLGLDPSTDAPPAWVRPEVIELVADAAVREAFETIDKLLASGKLSNTRACENVQAVRDDALRMLDGAPRDGAPRDGESLKALLAKGALHNVAYGMTTFGIPAIDSVALAPMRTIVGWVQGTLTQIALRGNVAVCEMIRRIDREVGDLLFQAGACTFDSVTRAVGASLANDTIGEILYRLDGRIDHLLLDEFQDTSLAQWRALKPLAESIAAGGEHERSILAVGDTKQSIYGWRSGDPRLLRGLHGLLNESGCADVRDETLATSWRSAPAVLAAVDHVFLSLHRPSHPLRQISDKLHDPNFTVAVEQWMDEYAEHVAAPKHATLTGCVRIEQCAREQHWSAAASKATELWRRSGGRLKIAVMARKNEDVGAIAHAIRSQPNAPPCALLAGGALTTSPAVVALIDAIRFAAHPDDLYSLLSVMQSPLFQVWGAQLPADWPSASESGARHRAARMLRMQFGKDSIASVVTDWVKRLDRAPTGTPFDDGNRRRVSQLIAEIGQAEDRGVSFDELIETLEACSLQDLPTRAIHAINIHQAKGLEWDIVIYAAESGTFKTKLGMAVARTGDYRGPDHDRVAPWMASGLATAHVQEVMDSAVQVAYQEFLSTLYVAITRAKRGLWVFIDDPSKSQKALKPGEVQPFLRSHGAILRYALDHSPLIRTDESRALDDEKWIDETSAATSASTSTSIRESTPSMPTRPKSPRVRTRVAHSASTLSEAVGLDVDVDSAPGDPLASRDAMAWGTIAHAVCESGEWMDDWKPDEAALVAHASSLVPFFPSSKIQLAVARVIAQLRAGKIASVLARPTGSAVAVRERQFLHFSELGGLRQGAIDRLVLHGKPGAWTRIEIMDFKTDRPTASLGSGPEWVTSRADHHRPQLEAYREAVAAEYNIDRARISISIVLLAIDEVVEV